MVKVKCNPRQLTLIMEGHAGVAARGNDLVCAGISAIVQALEYNLEKERDEKLEDLVITKRDGFFKIAAKAREPYQREMEKEFRYTVNGLRMVREDCPRAIRVHEEG